MPKASSADARDAAMECNVPEASRADDDDDDDYYDDDGKFQLMLMMLARFVHSRAGLPQIALCANSANLAGGPNYCHRLLVLGLAVRV